MATGPIRPNGANERKPSYLMPELGAPWPFPVTFLPNGWGVSIADVGPELAEKMLETNYENQRKTIQSSIGKYARDMTGGNWHLTHQGIAFNRNGQLHDGQNRLWAVMESGATVEMLVFFGAGESKEMTAFDTHKARTVYDAATIIGKHVRRGEVIALWMATRQGMGGGQHILYKLSHLQRIAAIEKHADKLNKLTEWYGTSSLSKKIAKNYVRAATLCAMNYVDDEKLKRFASVLTEQEDPKPGEGMAKKLRGWILANDSIFVEREAYLKSCRAIQLFAQNQEVATLYAPESNPFPFTL